MHDPQGLRRQRINAPFQAGRPNGNGPNHHWNRGDETILCQLARNRSTLWRDGILVGAFVLKKSLFAGLLAACTVFAVPAAPASAADLGGDCCADLEERIAELEATTARKGNRKVSLTVSGWVNQQVMFWDDGQETNTYVHDLGSTLGSHFKFSGAANFAPGWSAGYVLHIEGISSDGLTHNQFVDNGPGALGGNVQLLQSYWFVKNTSI